MATQQQKRPPLEKFEIEGTAVYPKLNEPDYKYKPAEGEYGVKIRMDGDALAPIEARIAKLLEAHMVATKASLEEQLKEATDGKKKASLKKQLADLKFADGSISDDVDEDGEPNGLKLVNVKMKAKVTYKSGKLAGKTVERKPTIVDATGKVLANPPSIWSGSHLVVQGELAPFYTPIGVGVSLQLKAVQIVKLVTAGQGGFQPTFKAREGGYEGDDEATSSTPTATSSEGSEGTEAENDDF